MVPSSSMITILISPSHLEEGADGVKGAAQRLHVFDPWIPLIYENGARQGWILTSLTRNEACHTTRHDGCHELGPGPDGSRK